MESNFCNLDMSPMQRLSTDSDSFRVQCQQAAFNRTYKLMRTFSTFSASSNALNVYTPFAAVACLIKSAQAAPVADFARTTNVCNAVGTVIALFLASDTIDDHHYDC